MNILYISQLMGNKWTGPNQSVPRQIRAQSKFDNVFWFNINDTVHDEWKDIYEYHSTNDYPIISLNSLPVPFDKPDLIVFQGLYAFPFCKIIFEAWKFDIPYIIIPRGALPKSAQSNKRLKKMVANTLFFNKFIKKARAIHYLTEQEFKDSGIKWNKNYFIIPNGIEIPLLEEKRKQVKDLKGVYIGRMDIYQKGLDLLIEVCSEIKSELINSQISIDIYGPDMDGAKEKLNNLISENDLSKVLTIKKGIFDEEKREVLNKSDFFIMTSRFEGHPMGLIEALSYGLPSLVTEGTNMAKEVEKANAGWTSNNELDGIRKAFLNLIKDKSRLAEISSNAVSLAKEYNWDHIGKITTDAYRIHVKK